MDEKILKHYKASILSLIIQNIENRILFVMMKYIHDNKKYNFAYTTLTPQYDGFMMAKNIIMNRY